MQSIFIEILHISFFTGILIGILFFATKLLHKRYSARWRYILWMIIVVRLLLFIPMPSLPIFSIYRYLTVSPSEGAYMTVTMLQSVFDENLLGNEVTLVHSTVEEPVSIIVDNRNSYMLNGSPIFMYIWLTGVVIFLLFHLRAYIKFHIHLKNSTDAPVPELILDLLEEQSNILGLKKFPVLRITNAIDSPVLTGLLFPQILLPHGNYNNDELAFILRHELIHYKRNDIFYKWILLLANALHWFNPLVYLVANQVAKDIELSCDDYVVGTLAEFELKQYCKVLVSTLPTIHTKKNVVLTEMGNSAKEMKKRLCNVLDRSHRQRGIVALCSLVACVIIATSLVRTSYNSIPVYPQDFEQFISFSNNANWEILATPEPIRTFGVVNWGMDDDIEPVRTFDALDLEMIRIIESPNIVTTREWDRIRVVQFPFPRTNVSDITLVQAIIPNDQLFILRPSG